MPNKPVKKVTLTLDEDGQVHCLSEYNTAAELLGSYTPALLAFVIMNVAKTASIMPDAEEAAVNVVQLILGTVNSAILPNIDKHFSAQTVEEALIRIAQEEKAVLPDGKSRIIKCFQ